MKKRVIKILYSAALLGLVVTVIPILGGVIDGGRVMSVIDVPW
ncbi:hypothetical protein [Paenibacillus arenosi]|nr:hypothetical protein [Paenibacillus arenosi]